ncbi:hypothetical protein ACFWAR_00740 [Streptomyces sp. NPDC059917]|uniref:hypothetical protein n=1 Tax=Streptomyces sp. NPDC059917 TaxID=3347002 RepID=UPI0036603AC1
MTDDEYMNDPDFWARALVNALGRIVGEVSMIHSVEPARRSEQAAHLSNAAVSVERITARLDELSDPDRPLMLGPIPGLPQAPARHLPYVYPDQLFIEVLNHRFSGSQRRALTGEMITVCEEVNYLLACTKGGAIGGAWHQCAAELTRCTSLYESAWQRFAAAVGDGTWETPPSPTLGPETTQAFRSAVEGLRAALDVLRRETRLVGLDSWVR